MDYLDITNGSGYQTYKGEYYAEINAPIGIDQEPDMDGSFAMGYKNPVLFHYEPVDTSRTFYQPSQNIVDRQAEETSIRTKSTIVYGKEMQGFVKLQDGKFYQIISVSIDRKSVSKQAAVYLPIPVGADFIVRLTRIDNPMKTYEMERSQ